MSRLEMFLLSLLFSWVGFFVVFFFCIDLNIPFENWSLCSFNDVKYKRISYDQWMNITMIDYMKKESLKILVVGRLMNCKYLLILMCFASSSGNKKNMFFQVWSSFSLYYLVLSFLLPFIFKTSAGMFYSLWLHK